MMDVDLDAVKQKHNVAYWDMASWNGADFDGLKQRKFRALPYEAIPETNRKTALRIFERHRVEGNLDEKPVVHGVMRVNAELCCSVIGWRAA